MSDRTIALLGLGIAAVALLLQWQQAKPDAAPAPWHPPLAAGTHDPAGEVTALEFQQGLAGVTVVPGGVRKPLNIAWT